jgi:hypothetical protein
MLTEAEPAAPHPAKGPVASVPSQLPSQPNPFTTVQASLRAVTTRTTSHPRTQVNAPAHHPRTPTPQPKSTHARKRSGCTNQRAPERSDDVACTPCPTPTKYPTLDAPKRDGLPEVDGGRVEAREMRLAYDGRWPLWQQDDEGHRKVPSPSG